MLKQPHAPKELRAHYSQDVYKATQSYSLDKMNFGIVHSLFSLASTQIFLWLGMLKSTWNTSVWLSSSSLPTSWRPESEIRREILSSVVFVVILLVSSTLTEIPWSLYKTFVIEQRHGFNKSTLGLFVSDTVKSLLLMLILVPPIIAGLTYILIVSGPLVALYLWGFVFTLSLLLLALAPFIMSLFNKFTLLEEGSLKSKIELLASKIGFPLRKLFSMDGSKRSGHANAFMFGFGSNKRIVLFDTLISKAGSEEEVVAVLAHELGHWKLGHTKALFVLSQAVTFLQFLAFTLIRSSPSLYQSFGFHDIQPALIALVLYQFISGPMDEAIGFGMNLISRIFEFQADRFAVDCGWGAELKSALLKLEEENKGAMWTDSWYSAYHYTHPPLVERLQALTKAQEVAVKKVN